MQQHVTKLKIGKKLYDGSTPCTISSYCPQTPPDSAIRCQRGGSSRFYYLGL